MTTQQRCERFDLVLVACLLALGFAFGVWTQPRVPACAEDTVIVGTGDFEHGHWTTYTCGPALDDLAATQ